MYNAATGYFGVVILAGAPIGLVAAPASRSWRGALAMLGFGIAGAVAGAAEAGSAGNLPTFTIGGAALIALGMGSSPCPCISL
jgi:hypothetical protein